MAVSMNRAVAPLSAMKTALVVPLMVPARRTVGTEGLLTAAERTSRAVVGGGSRRLGLVAGGDGDGGEPWGGVVLAEMVQMAAAR